MTSSQKPVTGSQQPLPALAFDRGSATPLYQQLYESLRQAILNRQLRPGQRLPPTRELAAELNISRSTVLLAFENLLAEGYVEGRTGAGTFVSRTIPEQPAPARPLLQEPQVLSPKEIRLSENGKMLTALPLGLRRDPVNLRPFRSGVPALREFPFEVWTRLLSGESRRLTFNDYGYSDPSGYRPLREAIAAHLRQTRAVRCEADQIIMTSGTQQALDLACRLLLNPGEAAWVEDPGYNGIKEALTAAGGRVVPVPVDPEGLSVASGIRLSAEARMAYITPSHQYPLGITMSLARRFELLEWASRQDAYILEDDYDSEYRYAGRPLSSLQGIDTRDRVIYFGTFSKVLFPGLRLGYLIAPPALTGAFVAAKAFTDRHCSVLEQAALARFIEEGHFGRHLRRMRLLYHERQQALIAAVQKDLGDMLSLHPADTGLHLTGLLPPGMNDRLIAAAAYAKGIYAGALSTYSVSGTTGPGLVLGYAAFNTNEIEKGVKILKGILEKFRK